MSRRLLGTCLGLAGLILGLSHPAHVSAKPPDLPIILEDVFATPVSDYYGLQKDAASHQGFTDLDEGCITSQPGSFVGSAKREDPIVLPQSPLTVDTLASAKVVPILPSDEPEERRPLVSHEAQRTIASCLLLVLHPGLVLIPTSPLVEEFAEKQELIDFLDGKMVRDSSEISDSVYGIWNAGGCENIVFRKQLEPFRNLQRVCWLWHSEPDDSVEVGTKTECPSKPTDTTMVGSCPWMRHHFGAPPVVPAANPVARRDVLANLECLLEAEELLQVAQRLLNRGMPREAVQCYEMVSKMCPGSWLDETARAVCAQYGKGDSEECESGKNSSWVAPVGGANLAKKSHPTTTSKAILDSITSIDFKDTPLRQVLDDVQNWCGIHIYLDQTGFQQAGIDTNTPITLKMEDVTLRYGLKHLLHPLGLTYVFKDNVLQIFPGKKVAKSGSSKSVACEAGVHEEVTGLIKACRLAVEMGRYQKAVDLVREAYALDAQRVASDPVLHKIHKVACDTLEYCVPCAVLGHVFGCKLIEVRLPGTPAATAKDKGSCSCITSDVKPDIMPASDESCEPWGVSESVSQDEPVEHAKGKGTASCCCSTTSGVAKTGGVAVGEQVECPIFFTVSPCCPVAKNQGGCVGVQVWFVPAGMEVRSKPNVTKKTCSACAGQTACCKEPMLRVSIPDVELVGDQVRLGWQVLVGSWTCQVRYDRSGLSVQTQTTPCSK